MYKCLRKKNICKNILILKVPNLDSQITSVWSVDTLPRPQGRYRRLLDRLSTGSFLLVNRLVQTLGLRADDLP